MTLTAPRHLLSSVPAANLPSLRAASRHVQSAMSTTGAAGTVELTDDGYAAVDARSVLIGTFGTLAQAEESLSATRLGTSRAPRGSYVARRIRDTRLAWMAGSVTAVAVTSAAAMLLVIEVGGL